MASLSTQAGAVIAGFQVKAGAVRVYQVSHFIGRLYGILGTRELPPLALENTHSKNSSRRKLSCSMKSFSYSGSLRSTTAPTAPGTNTKTNSRPLQKTLKRTFKPKKILTSRSVSLSFCSNAEICLTQPCRASLTTAARQSRPWWNRR